MVFGKYCLLERISVGGMAEVFRAKSLPAHESGNKMLALKRILPHLAEDDEFITMFVDEAKLTVQLDHPNIVQTYELGNFQSSYYILMEYIAGADVLTLQKHLRQERRIMSVAQACYVAEKTARGLHHAHTACDENGRPFNIIHRDVSPQNIRLTYDGRVKLIDFGIAKAAVQRTKTQVGVLKGKFGYMSPEQVHDEGMDHRADVFALGTTLWEMLTNRRLFSGENEFETLQLVKQLDVDPPSEFNDQVPSRVDEIVMRALSEDPDRRYQTADQMADALEEFRRSVDEVYGRDHLAQWMAETLSDELAEERRRRELYDQIRQPDDVRWFNSEYADEEEQAGDDDPEAGEAVVGDGGSEAGPESVETDPMNEIWDPDFAPDEDDEVDPEQFASDHTVVAAGGFDPSEFEDEDGDVISLGDEEIIELEAEEVGEADQAVTIEQGGSSGRDRRADSGGHTVDEHRDSGSADTVDELRDSGGASRSDSSGREAAHSGGGTPVSGGSDSVDTREESREEMLEAMEQDAANWSEASTEHTDDGRAEADETQPGEAVDGGGSGYGLRVAGAAAAVVALVAMTAIVGSAVFEGDGKSAGQASLVVTAEPAPAEEGEISIDGRTRGSDVPLTMPELEAGRHLVEIDYPGFESVEKKVTLEPGDLQTVSLQLQRAAEARATIHLDIDGVDTPEVFVDGEPVEWQDGEGIGVEPGPHLIEVRAAGRAPWSRVVNPATAETLTEHVDMDQVGLDLRIETSEPAVVAIDDERVGATPVTLEGLSPRKLHRLAVEAEAGGGRFETYLGLPRLGDRALRIDFDDPPSRRDPEDFGHLSADTGEDWWLVLVDGVQTGVTTPIADDERLPLAAGEQTVTFRRGNDMHELSVDIEAGQEVDVDEDLGFEWKTRAGR
jgi:serine/threonine protein kinase